MRSEPMLTNVGHVILSAASVPVSSADSSSARPVFTCTSAGCQFPSVPPLPSMCCSCHWLSAAGVGVCHVPAGLDKHRLKGVHGDALVQPGPAGVDVVVQDQCRGLDQCQTLGKKGSAAAVQEQQQ